MNKKKTTTQDMSEFGSIEGFDDIMGTTPDSSNRGIDELHGEKKTEKAPSKRAVKGAAAGCKVGYTRHTYMLPQKMIEQIKAVSQFFGITESSSAEQLIQKGLEAIEAVHGKKAVTLQKSKSLFEK